MLARLGAPGLRDNCNLSCVGVFGVIRYEQRAMMNGYCKNVYANPASGHLGSHTYNADNDKTRFVIRHFG